MTALAQLAAPLRTLCRLIRAPPLLPACHQGPTSAAGGANDSAPGDPMGDLDLPICSQAIRRSASPRATSVRRCLSVCSVWTFSGKRVEVGEASLRSPSLPESHEEEEEEENRKLD